MIPVAVRTKAQVCRLSIPGTAGSNSAVGMVACFVVLLYAVQLIACSEESYRVCVCVCVCVLCVVCVCVCV